jgi:carboxyl-terminal processing protease
LKKHLEGELKKTDDANTTLTKGKEKEKAKTKEKEPLKEDKTIVSQENLFKDMQLKSAVDAIKILSIKK